MRQKLLSSFRLRVIMLVAILFSVTRPMWGENVTWTHAFVSPNAVSNNAITVNGVTWSVSAEVKTGTPTIDKGNSYSNYCLKFGSGKNNCFESITFSTDYFNNYNVKSVSVKVLHNASKEGTLSATQGTTIIGTTAKTFGTTWTELTVNTTEGTGGTLSFTYSPTDCAVNINSITVVYTTGGGSSQTLETSDLTLNPSSLSFDLNGDSNSKTVSFTSSSTGAVSVSSSEYVTTTVDATNKTITVTPVKKTPSAQTITVSQAADDTYAAGSATFTVSVVNSNEPGASAANPYTVAQALDASASNGVYVRGIVSRVASTSVTSTGQIRYYISDDGSTSNEMNVYNGKGLNGAAFTSIDDIQVGDVVVVCGNISVFQDANQLSANNYLVSLTRKEVSSIALSGTYTTTFVEGSEFNHNGVVVTATYSDETTADVTAQATFSEPDMNRIGKQTITVTFNGKTATYDITITELPTHTATFSVNGTTSTQDFKEGASITFPSDPADIAGKTFVGWTDAAITGTTDIAPTMVTSATMGIADVTYYAVFATKTAGTQTTVTDVLTQTTTGITGTDYTEFTGKTSNSSAVYTGQCAGGNRSIQLRSSNSNSGVISTSSGGTLKKVTVVWNSNTSSGRTLDVYGNTKAYTSATELYSTGQNSNQGTKLGSIVYGTSTELTIEGNYQYIGLRSNSGAMYLTSITIEWETGAPDSYSGYCTTISETTATITLNAACTDGDMVYGTYSNSSAFVVSGDIVVAEVGIVDGKLWVEKYSTGAVVPANTGVMVSALEGGNYVVNLSTEAGTSVLGEDNCLRATGDAGITAEQMATADANCVYYRLTMHGANPSNNEPGTIGYWWGAAEGAAFAVAANKAYLAVSKADGARISGFSFDEDGTTTAIEDVRIADGKNAVYNLNGQRVAQPQKGMYIVNGKKVIK